MIGLSQTAGIVLGAAIGAVAAVTGAFLAGLLSLRSERAAREDERREARRLERAADIRAFQDAIEELGRRWHYMATLGLRIDTPVAPTHEDLVEATLRTHGYFNNVVKWASRVRDPEIEQLLDEWREITRRTVPLPERKDEPDPEYAAWLTEAGECVRKMLRRAGDLLAEL